MNDFGDDDHEYNDFLDWFGAKRHEVCGEYPTNLEHEAVEFAEVMLAMPHAFNAIDNVALEGLSEAVVNYLVAIKLDNVVLSDDVTLPGFMNTLIADLKSELAEEAELLVAQLGLEGKEKLARFLNFLLEKWVVKKLRSRSKPDSDAEAFEVFLLKVHGPDIQVTSEDIPVAHGVLPVDMLVMSSRRILDLAEEDFQSRIDVFAEHGVDWVVEARKFTEELEQKGII